MSAYRKNYADYIFKQVKEKLFIYLPGASSKSVNYDKFRDIGYQRSIQNYQTVKVWRRDVTPGELVFKQLGLVNIGAKKFIVKNADVSLFQLAARIVFNNEEYYIYNDAVGKKAQILPLDDNYTEITLFKKDV
jgi:hypothetical protein